MLVSMKHARMLIASAIKAETKARVNETMTFRPIELDFRNYAQAKASTIQTRPTFLREVDVADRR